MSKYEVTQVDVDLIAKGSEEVEVQVSEDLVQDDPDPKVGKDIVEQALKNCEGDNNGIAGSVG